MVKQKLPILSARYKIPSPRKDYVIRENLMDQLKRMDEKAVTIIKAGAGSGKTTLLSVYIREKIPGHLCWVTVDSGMDEAFLFWNYVFQAFRAELGERVEELQGCFEGGLKKEMLEQLVSAFAGLLDRENGVYLVLDDFQCIRDPYVLETLNLFVRMIPDNFHLIILTRKLPDMDLGILYMEDRLLLIDEEELRLTKEECREFLCRTLGLRDRGTDWVEEIVARANGWIGGAQLMAITTASGRNVGILSVSGDERVVRDYIEKEIFSALSEEEQQFLLKTSVLSYFNEEICARYLPEYNFSYMMRNISDKNLFVILIDEEKKEYRYHAILRDFLRNKLEHNQQRRKELFLRAADAYYELGDFEACIGLLFELREYEKLMALLLEMPQNAAIFSYMMQVPMEQIIKNPDFAYQYFFCHYAALENEQCDKIYSYIKRNLKDNETFRAFEYSNLFLYGGSELSGLPVLDRQQIEKLPLNQVSKAYLLIKEACLLYVADQISDAMEYLELAEQIYKDTHNLYIEAFILAEKAQILEEYGEFTRAYGLYDRMEGLLAQLPSMKGSFCIGKAGLYIRQLRLEEAMQELNTAKEKINRRDHALEWSYQYTLAEWYYASGYPHEAEEIIDKMYKADMFDKVFYSARLLRGPAYQGRNHKLAESFLENYEKAEDYMKSMDTELLYAGIIYLMGEKEKAGAVADKLLLRARKSGNKLKIVECALLKARMLFEQGAEDVRVTNLLTEAVEYAYAENIRIPFRMEKEFLDTLLRDKRRELEKALPKVRMEFLLNMMEGQVGGRQRTETLYDLTERELEVLKEIAAGCTNKEIAGHLCISLATVKTHLINIYGKLGVNNRLAAVHKLGGRLL